MGVVVLVWAQGMQRLGDEHFVLGVVVLVWAQGMRLALQWRGCLAGRCAWGLQPMAPALHLLVAWQTALARLWHRTLLLVACSARRLDEFQGAQFGQASRSEDSSMGLRYQDGLSGMRPFPPCMEARELQALAAAQCCSRDGTWTGLRRLHDAIQGCCKGRPH